MATSIDSILKAVNELRDTCPNLQIALVKPAVDGVCFETETGYTYKYEYVSGCVYRSYKTDWYTGIPQVLVPKVEG